MLEASTGQAEKDVQTEMDAQAALEQAWLEAWFLQQYWTKVDGWLDTGKAGSKAETFNDLLTARAAALTPDLTITSVADAETAAADAKTALEKAETQLAALVATTSAAQAVVADLGKRILRIDAELAELGALVTLDVNAPGPLEVAAAKRAKAADDFSSEVVGSEGEYTLAKAASEAAAAAIVEIKNLENGDPDPDQKPEGALAKAAREAEEAWTQAQLDAAAAAKAVGDALGDLELATLRSAVTDKSDAWTAQNLALAKLEGKVVEAWGTYVEAQKTTAARIEACQLDAYDAYRKALKKAMETREADLGKIKKLLEATKAPAVGTAGARCEKALSNGTYRPRMAQGRETVCDEGLCCGAARVWMPVGAGEEDAAWKTVETCQDAEAAEYAYQPPRAPMATTMPATVSVNFACIEGAQKLAAAASALAAAVYMLA